MNPPVEISTLVAGVDVHHAFLVVDIVVKTGDHPRTTLIFGNRSGKIESAPFWAGRDEMIRGLSKGAIVQVVGKVTAYRDGVQLEAASIRLLPKGAIPLAELVPSVGPVDRYWQFIDDTREKLTAPRLKAVLDLFYGDDLFRARYGECPGAPGTGHHAKLGGLLQHTCEVLAIAMQIARVAKADLEIVVAGVLLHDIGKLQAYRWEGGIFDTTERGRLVGHVVEGAMMLRDALREADSPPCTADEAMILEHLILAPWATRLRIAGCARDTRSRDPPFRGRRQRQDGVDYRGVSIRRTLSQRRAGLVAEAVAARQSLAGTHRRRLWARASGG